MKFSVATIIGIGFGIAMVFVVVSNMRPVHWFDSLLGIAAGVAVGWYVRHLLNRFWCFFREKMPYEVKRKKGTWSS
tara:strand:- start:1035 stop:1262 length:228 start_codon:yes stop_codon:yes gene_type:complete